MDRGIMVHLNKQSPAGGRALGLLLCRRALGGGQDGSQLFGGFELAGIAAFLGRDCDS